MRGAAGVGSALSRPSRGAWIETGKVVSHGGGSPGRALHGARGLKPYGADDAGAITTVAPFTGRVD